MKNKKATAERSANFNMPKNSPWKIPTINRVAVVIAFKEKILKWVNALPDADGQGFTLEMLNQSKTIYLIPDFEDQEASLDWFSAMESVVLDEAFASICTDPSLWPEKKKFSDYLTIEFHEMIYDLEMKTPLKRER